MKYVTGSAFSCILHSFIQIAVKLNQFLTASYLDHFSTNMQISKEQLESYEILHFKNFAHKHRGFS